MHRDPEPFSKWDPDGADARRQRAARFVIDGMTPEEADRRAQLSPRTKDPLAGKKWLLRWVWMIATLFMVFGYLILIVLVTGHGDHFHLT